MSLYENDRKFDHFAKRFADSPQINCKQPILRHVATN
jgi:hypothetical protein